MTGEEPLQRLFSLSAYFTISIMKGGIRNAIVYDFIDHIDVTGDLYRTDRKCRRCGIYHHICGCDCMYSNHSMAYQASYKKEKKINRESKRTRVKFSSLLASAKFATGIMEVDLYCFFIFLKGEIL